jgi:predicted NBD/HSP70 family sugar kinase
MGQLNRRALLICLQRLGAASRAELAKRLRLSQPTTGRIVDGMLREGLIEETGVRGAGLAGETNGSGQRNRAGRPGRVLRLNQSRPRFLGIHLDVHETQLALMPMQPKPADEWHLTLPTPGNGAEWLGQMQACAGELRIRQPLGIIVSVPGIVDENSGQVLFSPNLHWTEKAPLSDLIGEVWDAPVVFVQELRALALGHRMFDESDEDFLSVDVGEGLGAAAVIAGGLYRNQLPLSGELGHTPVVGNTRRCGCGATGCLETLLSSRGLLESFAIGKPRHPCTWAELVRSIEETGIPRWLVDTLDAAGSVIAGALNVLGIRKVVVTGLLGELPEGVREHLQQAIARGTIWQRFGQVTCKFAPRHRTAGMIAVGIDRCVVPAELPDASRGSLNRSVEEAA